MQKQSQRKEKLSQTSPNTTPPPILKYFLISLFFSLPLFWILFSFQPTTTATTAVHGGDDSITEPDLKIRPVYTSYETYINYQLNKTQNPKLRNLWKTRDWDRKIKVFSSFFSELKQSNLISNSSKALCIGARLGQEVEALRRVGVADSVGLDLVQSPPLVIKADFHRQPFDDETFDFEFSNVFDHALYPDKFVGEIEQTLRDGGLCVLHVALNRQSDKFSANDLYSVKPLVKLFISSELLYVRKVDGFGLDTEVVFRKKNKKNVYQEEKDLNVGSLSEAPVLNDVKLLMIAAIMPSKA